MAKHPPPANLPCLIFRADGGAVMGAGHVMRCLALAQAWRRAGGRALLALATHTPALMTRWQAEGLETAVIAATPGSDADAELTAILANRHEAPWVALDGYHFSPAYQKRLLQAGVRLLVVDDNGEAGGYHAELVLNQNLHAHKGLYVRREAFTELLLGPRYVLLRQGFLRQPRTLKPAPPLAGRLLVTLGGGDAGGLLEKVLHGVAQAGLPDLEVTVIKGASAAPLRLPPRAAGRGEPVIRELSQVQNMPEVMAEADLALSAAGSTCWELAYMGVPMLTVVLADNQRQVAASLEKHGVAASLGWHEDLTPERVAGELAKLAHDPARRGVMAARGRELVDGAGASRVLGRLLSQRLTLREVTAADCRLLWEWANDPDTRAASFNTAEIPWEAHVQWFEKRLASPDCLILVALNDAAEPIGQVRFEREGDAAILSTSVALAHRGRRYGAEIVRTGSLMLFMRWPVAAVHAYVKTKNPISRRVFERAGFRLASREPVHGHPVWRFVLQPAA